MCIAQGNIMNQNIRDKKSGTITTIYLLRYVKKTVGICNNFINILSNLSRMYLYVYCNKKQNNLQAIWTVM